MVGGACILGVGGGAAVGWIIGDVALGGAISLATPMRLPAEPFLLMGVEQDELDLRVFPIGAFCFIRATL